MKCRYYTDEEARQKRCPTTKEKCYGKECMMWTWTTLAHKNTIQAKVEAGPYRAHWKTGEPVGYCAMKELQA